MWLLPPRIRHRLQGLDGGAWLSDDVPSILGRPARSYQQFTHDYAPAFS